MKRKKLFSSAAAAAILLSMFTACTQSDGGNGGGNTTTTAAPGTTAPPSTMQEEQQSRAEEISTKEFELENKKITFLASWARNPANGKNKDVAIELFQTVVSLILILITNWIGRKISDTGLW